MSKKGNVLVVGLIFALIIAIGIAAYFFIQTQQLQSASRIYITPTPTQEVVQNIQSFPTNVQNQTDLTTFVDPTGFGYKLSVPEGWTNILWQGGHSSPEPKEIAQVFMGPICRPSVTDRISITHFLSSNPDSLIQKDSQTLQNDGFTGLDITLGNGMKATKLTGSVVPNRIDYYVFVPTTKGYYNIFGTGECTGIPFESTFDKTLNSFTPLE